MMRDAQTFHLPDPAESAADWLAETVRAYLKNVTSRRPSARAFLQMCTCRLISTPTPARVKATIDEAERSTRRALRP